MMNRLIAATSTFEGPAIQWFKISPILALLGGALFLILVGSLTPQWKRGWYATASVITAITAAVLTGVLWNQMGDDKSSTLVGGALAFDHFALFATFTICVAVALVSLVTNDYLTREGEDGPEIYGLMLTAAIGGVVMVSANDLLVLFLGLETLSLSFYLLTASSRSRTESGEAGLKYFILGGFASAFFLYGVALLFGASGTTNLQSMAKVFAGEVAVPSNNGLLLAGIALLLVGFAFKVSLVPFHVWTPDVYQGAPTPITALMGSVGKVAAFAALIRVFMIALPSRIDDWRPAILVLALLTLVVGSVLAVVQTDVKRMLAYSSISHAGFILVGLEAASHIGHADADLGISSAMGYLFIYSILVIGTFAVVSVVAGQGDNATTLDAFKGIGKKYPVFALGMTVLLLAQAGVPLTSGFVAKFGIIRAAVSVESYALAVAAMLAAVIAAFLYLRIMVSMWLSDPADDAPVSISRSAGLAITLAVATTLIIGVLPNLLLGLENIVSL
jgi:NADH-quinone oxidoreductase subunit N